MIEIEVKGYANEDVFERVRESFELIRKEHHEDTYFRHPCRDFAETDEALRIRIRRFNGHFEAFLTYKGPKIDQNSKTRKEIEVPISDPDRHTEILRSLGFEEVLTIEKTREKYYVDKGIIIDLDEVEGLGKFIEIEMLTQEPGEITGIIERLKNILKELGVKKFETRSYLELIMEGRGEHGKAR
ncbi:class IV adenylate cyclase [Thermococcus sp. 21S7]|uniref:class IV adenylate cyclase n=1 Tax=Thermococcus sp. 21S7 TaxID=1638221 RepID=UPI00143960E5|nr:class IV adenylate cyclase [Thermococcus sp. 21S7]NJE60802.1 class IV adenylate cyclase [Thermococcus sp. 21S7]